MGIIINNLTYTHPDGENLFRNLSFSVATGEKAALIGDNGSGKSTLIRILAGGLSPSSGEVAVAGEVYFVPQHFGQYDGLTVAGALGLQAKTDALRAIEAGDTSESNYSAVGDDWDITERIKAAIGRWGLDGADADTPMTSLSGGEKTKVFLAGAELLKPDVILMDEPTNHLDTAARERLYRFIGRASATMLIVSHDRALLAIPQVTFELSPEGVARYGGNYEFYREMRDAQLDALEQQLDEKEKALRAARIKARHVLEQKQKSDARSPAKERKERTLPGLIDKKKAKAQESTAKLKEIHAQKIGSIEGEARALRGNLPASRNLKIALDDPGLHKGKMLVTAREINFAYPGGEPLWAEPLSFRIESGERIAVRGGNGSGKTTLLRLILGELTPTEGELLRADFTHIYIDQEYSLIDNSLTLYGQLERYNRRNLPEHWLKQELHRFLFPADTWDKPCGALSGGEKMKLILCCLLIADDRPDMFVLDEPTNNLDIRSMDIVTGAVRDYGGTVLVISHDGHFLRDIGVGREIEL